MNRDLLPPSAFTIVFKRRVSTLVSEVLISAKPFDAKKEIKPQNTAKFIALWDTGATNSVITERVVQACGLQPIGMTQVFTASGANICPVFLVGIGLPNNLWVNQTRVTLGQLSGEIDLLIGMDIIGMGDFAITHKGDQTMFSFRVPCGESIDFVKDINSINRIDPRPGRNAPCPCGSGKKYKNCHGKIAKV